ncbi:hypothetical protein I3842_04G156000 [Carya illinoinensis]|uniref:CCHC-type domain-containing protein n=1 Tax=Carya illinoinensis TaxID=32201 RepID=A0A922F9F5_CARIL|nr:hypothetical protein I3842_04G156000 [Carya illinoinensis]
MSFEDFQAELLNYEILLGNQHTQQSNDSGNFALSNHNSKSSNYKGRNSGPPRQNFQSSKPEGFKPKNENNQRVPCQICGKMGHQALDCYNRMNYSYQGRYPPAQLAAMAARMNSAESEEQPWFADSGANNHIIADMNNLTIQEPFKGDEEVAVGNGAGLPILNTGSSTLFHSQNSFKFKNVLHCPNAAANLLSIQRFCFDNSCWFKLTDTHFFVKDNLTGRTLMQGQN